MEKHFLSVSLIISLFVASCSTFKTVPPSSTPTIIPTFTATPIPTITSTPFPSPTPTVEPTPVELDENGLPIFPEESISRGDGIEVSFSQSILNDLDIKGVAISPDTLNNLKQMLIGQWLYILVIPGYTRLNPKSFDDMERANSKTDGIGIQLEGQYINIKPDMRVEVSFVKGCREADQDEFGRIGDFLSENAAGRLLSERGYGSNTLGRLQGGGRNITGYTYIESNSIRFVNYVDCVGLVKYYGHPEEAVAEMLRSFSVYSYETILLYLKTTRGYASTILSKKFEERIITYQKKDIRLAILGGCQLSEFFCSDGSENWNFSVMIR